MTLRLSTLVFTVFVLIHSPTDGGQARKAASWIDSKYICMDESDYGRVVGYNHTDLEDMLEIMKTFDHPSIWIGLHRERRIFSQFPDGQVFAAGNKDPGSEQSFCSYLDIRDHFVDSSSCKGAKHAFICQIKDCSTCHQMAGCRQIDDVCYVTSCRKSDWYSARQDCKKRGGDLLVASETVSHVLDSAVSGTSNEHSSDCVKYWIGASNTEWRQDSLELMENPESGPWADGEPSDFRSHDCVVLTKVKGVYGWKTVSCEEEHSFICQTDLESFLLTKTHNDFTAGNADDKNIPKTNGETHTSDKFASRHREGTTDIQLETSENEVQDRKDAMGFFERLGQRGLIILIVILSIIIATVVLIIMFIKLKNATKKEK